MDEHSSPADAAETAAPPGPSDLSPPRRLAERVKACGDAATAILKALILALAIVIICAIAGAAIWRDQHRRTIAVAVDPGAEQALRAHGTDFDLRQALVDVVNDRVRGVAEIVKIDFAGLAGPAEPDISFKPFGLELSTGDVVRIMRYVLGGTPPPDVRIGLACAPQVCAATGAGDGRLLVTVTDPSGSRRRAYPIPLASPALRRALHRAIDSSADLVLEQTQPLIAAIYYLNRPLTQLFPDAQRRNRERAEGMALKARGQAGATRCIADLVIGGSLFYRGDLRQGLTAENRAAASGDPTCLVHAETNIVGLLVPFALCDRSPAGRERAGKWAHEAVVRLAAIRRVTVGDQAYYRIPIAKLTVDMLDAVRAVDDEAGRMAI